MIGVLAAAAFIVAWAAALALASRFASFAQDQPNERSLHERPVPRTGGVALLLGASLATFLGAADLWMLFAVAVALAGLSFVDDLRKLPILVRFTAHLAAAAFAVWFFLRPLPPHEIVLLILAIAWLTNLYNFMDGSDGLAGGMALFGFGAYGAAAWLTGHAALASLCVALAAAAAGFLVHNLHPARIFLGDVGSIPLGFLAGALGLLGWRDDVWPLWFPLLVFAPFIGDATVTLARRALRGERVWQAHREHFYQRMVLSGLGHRGTAWVYWSAMALCALLALLARFLGTGGAAA